ncbi:barstar family protein [Streptomyces sp. NPDC026672]|uniref:barstar family protein n=1 Tax=unclassified Streptomyces TaxID=2593676 RepID=UPI00340D75CA
MGAPEYAVTAYGTGPADHEPWALCESARNLFADPPAPARAVYELLGCAPEGSLRAALARARTTGSAPLGTLVLEPFDDRYEWAGEWYLEGVRIIGDRPAAHDPSLRDITVEAAQYEDDPPDHAPSQPGYRLAAQGRMQEELLGTCQDVVPHPGGRPGTPDPPVRLLGCEVSGALRAAMEAGEEYLGHARVIRLDRGGRPLQTAAEGELISWIPSAHGPGRVDLALEPWSDRPPPAARQVWQAWEYGRPAEPGAWSACGASGREYWLTTALDNRDPDRPDAPPGSTFHLDGRHVTDIPGFFCALGEAVNGPGGYFGRSLDATADCLCGNYGAAWPFVLVWHDSHVARTCLGPTPLLEGPPSFEEVLDFFEEKGIDVRLV